MTGALVARSQLIRNLANKRPRVLYIGPFRVNSACNLPSNPYPRAC